MVIAFTVAWATPVDPIDLGARIEAYIMTKATISTFGSCIRYAPKGSPLARLPAEIQEFVGAHIQETVFENRRKAWAADLTRCGYEGRPGDGYSTDEIDEGKAEYLDKTLDFGYVEECHGEVCTSTEESVYKCIRKIMERFSVPQRETRLARWRKIFSHDFGLSFFFKSFYHFQGDQFGGIPHLPAHFTFAYLSLPSFQSPVEAELFSNLISPAYPIMTDTSILREPSSDERLRFKKVMSALRLKPHVHIQQLDPLYPTWIRVPGPGRDLYSEPVDERELHRMAEGGPRISSARHMKVVADIFRSNGIHGMAKAYRYNGGAD